MKDNILDGRNSFDVTVGDISVPFFNRNISPYPTESGSVKFEMIPVTKQKDIMINNANLFAQQEYDRIMELVSVLQKQADQIKRRLDMTHLVHSCTYNFQLSMGHVYWVVRDKQKDVMILTGMSPEDWSSGVPLNYEYLIQVKYLGDHSWIEIE
jgi:hypothetical protein